MRLKYKLPASQYIYYFIILLDTLNIYSSPSPSMPPAIMLAKFLFLACKADNSFGIASGTIKFSIQNFFEVFIAFSPLSTAIKTLNRANIACIIAAFDPYSLSVY